MLFSGPEVVRPFSVGANNYSANRPFEEPSGRQMSAGTVTVNYGQKPQVQNYSPGNQHFGQKNVAHSKPQNYGHRHSTGGFNQPRPTGLVPKRSSFAPRAASTMPSRTRPY